MVTQTVYESIQRNKNLCQYRLMLSAVRDGECWVQIRRGPIEAGAPGEIFFADPAVTSSIVFLGVNPSHGLKTACGTAGCFSPFHLIPKCSPGGLKLRRLLRRLKSVSTKTRLSVKASKIATRKVLLGVSFRWLRKYRTTKRSDEYHAARKRSERRRAYKRDRKDPKKLVTWSVRGRIIKTLAKRGGTKNQRTFTALGYTPAQLASHVERQFLKGMSWENYGEWHLDHIIPLASFNYTRMDCPEFRAAWALTNLRPMWAKENIRKGCLREHLL